MIQDCYRGTQSKLLVSTSVLKPSNNCIWKATVIYIFTFSEHNTVNLHNGKPSYLINI